MNRDRLLWWVGGALIVAGCGPSGPDPKLVADATACWRDGDARIARARSCQEAVTALRDLVERSPECAAVFGPDGAIKLVCDPVKGGAP